MAQKYKFQGSFVILAYLALVGCFQIPTVNGSQFYMKGLKTTTLQDLNNINFDTNRLYFELINNFNDVNDVYWTKLFVGNPPKETLMVIDTGGMEPWIPCFNHTSAQPSSRYQPSISTTYESVLCDSPLCKRYPSSWSACNRESPMPCNFSEKYVASFEPKGILSKDSFAFSAHGVQFENITFGCIYDFGQTLSGNLGLNTGIGSFYDQIATTYGTYMIISYCLSLAAFDIDAKSWMALGGQRARGLDYVPLVGPIRGLHTINLKGITVDNKVVDVSNISTLAYDSMTQVGGFVLDIGARCTWLGNALHLRFMDSFLPAMKKNTGMSPNSNYSNHQQVCYAFDSLLNIYDIKIPHVIFHLENDVDIHLHFEELFFEGFVNDYNQQIWCLAFINPDKEIKPGDYEAQTLGLNIQQNMHIELDRAYNKVGFAHNKQCKKVSI